MLATVVTRVREWGRPSRILGIDVACGIAIIGMMAAHMASLPTLEWSEPSTWGGVAVGRSAMLFAFLAGVSLALVSRNPRYHSVEGRVRFRLELVGRAMAIFAIGLILELASSGLVLILTVYGVYFLCMIPFIWVPTKRLVLMVIGFGILGPMLLAGVRSVLLSPSAPGIDLAVFGMYGPTTWLPLMLAGLAFGRQNLQSIKVACGAILVGVLLAVSGYGAGVVASKHTADLVEKWSSSYGYSGPTEDPIVDVTDGSDLEGGGTWERDQNYLEQVRANDPEIAVLTSLVAFGDHSGAVTETIGSGGLVLAVVGLCLLITRRIRLLVLPIACAGSMPLTAYSAHVLGYMVLAGGPNGSLTSTLPVFAWSVAAILLTSMLWALTLGKGPLERLVARAATSMAKGA